MFTRRRFVVSAAGLAAGAALLTRSELQAQAVPRRRPLHEMDLDDPDLVTFRGFVGAMRNADRNPNVLNWSYLARIHATFCPHGNWYFLPWHRAYLRMYERLARDVTGNQGFALPYWDWTSSPGFPRAFAEPTFNGQANPLFLNGRSVGAGSRMPANMVGPRVIDRAMAQTVFERFGSSRPQGQNSTDPGWIQARGIEGPLEAIPHNRVHGAVGGVMAAMESPLDPVFLMHHGHIDYLWALWMSRGRTNSRNRLWREMVFPNQFIGSDGQLYSERVTEMEEVVPLGFTFGLEPQEPDRELPRPPAEDRLIAVLSGEAVAESLGAFRRVERMAAAATPERPASLAFELPAGALPAAVTGEAGAQSLTDVLGSGGGQTALGDLLQSGGDAPAPAAPQGQAVYAVLRRIATSAPAGTQLRLFVNRPDAGPATPTEDPHFAGAIGFFASAPGEICQAGGDAPTVALDITETLARLSGLGRLAGPVSLQLVAAGHETGAGGRPGSVCPETVELAVV